MLRVGPQELVALGALLLFLVIFGSDKFSRAARDLGYLLGGAKRTAEDAKSEPIPDEVNEAHRAIKDLGTEVGYGTERDKRRRKT
jgi:Sec-independent protein translocase protein TatA